jgi:putative photosynthetic complex assembly protein
VAETEPGANRFPRLPLAAAGLLVGFVILAAAYGSMTGLARPEGPSGSVVAERSLRFADRADGAVVVSLADTGQVLDVMTGQNGFLRGTLRGFARERRMDGIGQTPPLRLTGYSDGRLVLLDPADGRQVDLEAFGSNNVPVFARFLTLAPRAETVDAVKHEGGS